MKKYILFILLLVLLISCSEDGERSNEEPASNSNESINNLNESNEANLLHEDEVEADQEEAFDYTDPNGSDISSRIRCPEGFERIEVASESSGYFLRHLELKDHGAEVLLYNGREKANQSVHVAVFSMSVGNRDLHQCADATMRLRAEYLRSLGRDDEIHFNFTNGFRVDYKKWMQGYRIKVDGNDVSWVLSREPSNTDETFNAYMNMIFSYAGTLSLSEELSSVSIYDMQIGDVFVQGGSPGHAVIVVDMARHIDTDEIIFLLAQSYMPAQDIHILKNPNCDEFGPWYKLDDRETYITPEWVFESDTLKRY